MTKNRDIRKSGNIEAEVIVCGRIYAGTLSNLSSEGAYVEVPLATDNIDFTASPTLELKFNLSSEESVNIFCRVAHAEKKETPQGPVSCIGLKIEHIPSQYREFFKTL